MIRHYENTGLLNPIHRSASGYRQFNERDVNILRFIRQARLMGFSTQQINKLITLWQDPQRSSRQVRSVASQHLHEVRQKLTELQQMESTLEHMINACHGNDNPTCAILDTLSPTPDP